MGQKIAPPPPVSRGLSDVRRVACDMLAILFADQAALQEDLLELMPEVGEVNSISEEMDRRVKFELMLVCPYMMGRTEGRAEVSQQIQDYMHALGSLLCVFVVEGNDDTPTDVI